MRYKGLQSYTEADSANFKGRSSETKELLDMLHTNDVVVCYAASGEGKSSLINAGLCPLLRKELVLPIHITFNETDFLNEKTDFDSLILGRIADTVDKMNETITDQDSQIGFVPDEILIERLGPNLYKELDNIAWWKLRMGHICNNYQTFMPLLIFDQFEEIFSNSKSDVWINGFFQWYSSFCSTSLPEQINDAIWNIHGDTFDYLILVPQNKVKTLFSLRNDYIGDLDYWCNQRYKITALKDTRYLLKPLMKGGAEEILDLSDFNKEIKNKIISYVCRDESQPCISALILSVLCTVLSADSRTDISCMSDLSVLIEDFYKDKISVLDTADVHELECSLVGEKNNRLRIPFNADRFKNLRIRDGKFVDLNDRTINLDVFKILRLNNSYYIELVHDCLCPIVSKKKMQYIDELADKKDQAERQKKNVLTSVWLAGHLLFFVYSLFCFYGPVVSARIGWNFSGMGDMCFGLLSYIPAIVALYTSSSFLKNNINKWDVWLYAFSEILLLINIFYLNDKTNYITERTGNRFFYYLLCCSLVVGGLMLYAFANIIKRTKTNNDTKKSPSKNNLYKQNIYWRVYVFLLSTITIVFLVEFDTLSSLSWLCLILPILFYNIPSNLNRYKYGNILLISWLLLLICDIPINIITYLSFINKIPGIFVLALCVLLTIASIVCVYKDKRKRSILILSNILVITATYSYCLGFIPFVQVGNPLDVVLNRTRSKTLDGFTIKSNDNGIYHYGICNSNGDTIISPIFDSCIQGLKGDSLSFKINAKTIFPLTDYCRQIGIYIKNDTAHLKPNFFALSIAADKNRMALEPICEELENKLEITKNDLKMQQEYLFSKGYNEILNSMFMNLSKGESISSNSIPSIKKLFKTTQCLLDSVVNDMRFTKTRMNNGYISDYDQRLTDYYKYNCQLLLLSAILDSYNKDRISDMFVFYIASYQHFIINEIKHVPTGMFNYSLASTKNSIEISNKHVRFLLEKNIFLKQYYKEVWELLIGLVSNERISFFQSMTEKNYVLDSYIDSLMLNGDINMDLLDSALNIIDPKSFTLESDNVYKLSYIDNNIKTSIDLVECMGNFYNSQLRLVPYRLLEVRRMYGNKNYEIDSLFYNLKNVDEMLNNNIYMNLDSICSEIQKVSENNKKNKELLEFIIALRESKSKNLH